MSTFTDAGSTENGTADDRQAVASTASTPFHLSLNVANLGRSVDFFRHLFDLAPAKQRDDYAKFEVANPPLVLSLQPFEASAAARLNHLGIRLADSAQLVELQRRLEAEGIPCQREEGVACCYSRQTKFWVTDPDNNLWELYTVEEDLECRSVGQLPMVQQLEQAPRRPGPAPAVWVHRLGEPVVARLRLASSCVDEVLLQGSFNGPLAVEERAALLGEVRRMLKPGGQLTVHGLSADRTIANVGGRLPGPAAAVSYVPAAGELIADLEGTGFEGIHFSKLDDSVCFTLDDCGLRETLIVAYRPVEISASAPATHAVLYKGPFRSLQDDCDRDFRRGQWTQVDESTWERLKASAIADQFLFRAETSPTR